MTACRKFVERQVASNEAVAVRRNLSLGQGASKMDSGSGARYPVGNQEVKRARG
jgi:hypothetical protein